MTADNEAKSWKMYSRHCTKIVVVALISKLLIKIQRKIARSKVSFADSLHINYKNVEWLFF